MGALIDKGGEDSCLITIDPRLGVISAAVKYWAPDQLTACTAPAPAIPLNIPEWNPRKISRDKAGENAGYHVVVGYEGHPNPASANGEYFELEGSTTEDPIDNHWNLQVLLSQYQGTPAASSPTGIPTWPTTFTDASGQVGPRNPMHGVQKWRMPGLIWNDNWVAAGFDDELVSRLGTIGTPNGDPPSLSAGRNWLLMRVRAKFRANIWQFQASWELSGPYGWVPEMYPQVVGG